MSTESESLGRRFKDLTGRRVDPQQLLNLISPLLIILAWEIAVNFAGLLDPRLYPPPSVVVHTMWALTVEGVLPHETYITMRRIIPAFAIGSFLGILTGLLMGFSDRIDAVADPIVTMLYPLPRVVILPIIFLFLGITETARITVLAIGIYLLMVISTVGGAKSVDPVYIEAAKDNGASGVTMLREVYLPASLPHIFSGLSLSVGTAYVVIVVIEFIAASSGLGFFIWDSWGLFAVHNMYAGVITLGILGFISIYGTELIGKWLMRWNRDS